MQKALQSLEKSLQADIIRKDVRKGAKVIADQVKQNALGADPSGELSAAVAILNNPDDRTGVYVTTRRSKRHQKGYIAHIVEYGAAPHLIRAKKGKKLAFKRGDKSVVVDEVSHPGVKAHPFLRPAWETKKDEALERIGQALKKTISGGATTNKPRVR